MKRSVWLLLVLGVAAGCNRSNPSSSGAGAGAGAGGATASSLKEARQGFQTKLVRQEKDNQPADRPPRDLFQLVHYDSPAGKLAAYLSLSPGDGKKHPAVVWIFGGFDNGIGDTAWKPADPSNDQSASAFYTRGIPMLYPSLRGGNDNPGFKEGFYGEVDDVLAAAEFLARRDFVDPERIYLGGHSTGGTLALLAAESSNRFRAVFSFGPVDNVAGYGPNNLPFDLSNPREVELRAPVKWLHAITCPTFVFEGARQGNTDCLNRLAAQGSANPMLHFYPVKGATHFSTLAPITQLLAHKIEQDAGSRCSIRISQEEVDQLAIR